MLLAEREHENVEDNRGEAVTACSACRVIVLIAEAQSCLNNVRIFLVKFDGRSARFLEATRAGLEEPVRLLA